MRRILTVLVGLVMVVTLSAPAHAQAPVQDRINAAFKKWMSTYKVSNAGLVVMRDHQIVGSYGYNEMSAETPAHVASLSKAITAVCVMSLIDEGRLRFTTMLQHVPRFRILTQPWASKTVGRITIGSLLRHTSRITYDPTQEGLVGIPNSASADLILIRRALSRPLATSTREVYNNINYAILGRVIQLVTGESYEKYCKRKVLTPRGAPNAKIGPGVRAMGAYGGWQISAVEYARFARAYDLRARLLSPAAHAFIKQRAVTTKPTASLGMYVVRTASGYNLFHHGNWRSTATTPREFSAFFALWDNGIAVVVTYDRALTDAARVALDNMLREASYGR